MTVAGQVHGTGSQVGLVTVSYQSHDALASMLESLTTTGTVLAAGVIADNHPEPSIERLAEIARFAYLPLENHGYGSAVNSAVHQLPGSIEWVVISNPDVTFEQFAIDRMLAVGNSDPLIAAVGPRIVDENGGTYPSARAIPSLRTGIGHGLFGRIWPANPWSQRYLQSEKLDTATIRDTGWLSGACILVRRSVFGTLGGFDEDFFMYFEDVDLGYRIGCAGYRNVYAPSAVIHHVGGTSTSGVSERMLQAHHASARLFISHKYPGPLLAPVRGLVGFGLRIRERLTRPRH